MAESLHDKGSQFEKRQFKLFTFSRLLGRFEQRAKEIAFLGPISLWIASPLVKILESFASHIVKKGKVKLGDSYLRPTGVEVAFAEELKNPLLVRTLSPITVYSTLQSGDGKKKTYYYSPFEAEFSKLISENLFKKRTILHDSPLTTDDRPLFTPLKNHTLRAEPDSCSLSKGSRTDSNCSSEFLTGFTIKPEKVSNRNQHIIMFKGTVIKAWSGIYRIEGSPELMQIAFDTGLGSKNSQGFGMVEKWQPACGLTSSQAGLK